MRIIEKGYGEPKISLIGGIHGDEPSGEQIITYLDENIAETDVQNGTLQLIIANEAALQQDKRYIESDINRSFSIGNPHNREEHLAQKLIFYLSDSDYVLALHSSQSAPPPFAMYSNINQEIKKIMNHLPIHYAVNTGQLGERETTLDSKIANAVTVEVGKQHSQQAIETGKEIADQFIQIFDLIDKPPYNTQPKQTEIQHIIAERELRKEGSNPNVYYKNFQEIPKNAIIAEDSGITHRATTDNKTPILLSETGYTNIFGLIGRYASYDT